MKLNFIIAADDGMLECNNGKYYYIIWQLGNVVKATVNGEDLLTGDLYECLDACNHHAEELENES